MYQSISIMQQVINAFDHNERICSFLVFVEVKFVVRVLVSSNIESSGLVLFGWVF